VKKDERSLRQIALDTINGTLETRDDDVTVKLPDGKTFTLPRVVADKVAKEPARSLTEIIEADSFKEKPPPKKEPNG